MTATSNTGAYLNLRVRAMQALAEHRKTQDRLKEKRQQEERQARAKLLAELLRQRLGIEVEPDDETIELDGLTFAANKRHRGYMTLPVEELRLVDRCVKCGEPVMSGDIQDFADLGSILESWVPRHLAGCDDADDELEEDDADDEPEPPMTTEHWLAEAIRQVVHNELRERGYVGDR